MTASRVGSNGILVGRGTRVAECSSPNINARVNSKGSVAPDACNTYSEQSIILLKLKML